MSWTGSGEDWMVWVCAGTREIVTRRGASGWLETSGEVREGSGRWRGWWRGGLEGWIGELGVACGCSRGFGVIYVFWGYLGVEVEFGGAICTIGIRGFQSTC